MTPVNYHTQEERDFRVNVWRNNLVPYNQNDYGDDPRKIEVSKKAPAELTELGRKLLGDLPW